MRARYRHMVNVLSGNLSQIVGIAVNLLVTRLVVRQLGLGTYGLVAFVVSLGAIVGILGNALSGAAARYITQSIARGDNREASSYLTNTLAAVGGIGAAAIMVLNLYAFLSPGFLGEITIAFMNVMLVSVTLRAMGGVLSAGSFVREKFVARAMVRIAGRLVYGCLIAGLLSLVGLGVWSLAWGTLVSSLVVVVCFAVLLRRFLPLAVVQPGLISSRRIWEVGEFVGWVLLTYCGSYLIRSGTLIAVRKYVTEIDLGRYALVMQIGSMLLGSLASISVMVSPGIYRALAVGKFRVATTRVERFMFLATCLGLTGTLCLAFEGENLLRVWLGKSAPPDMNLMLIGCGLSALVASFGVPLSVFLAGCSRIRGYGVACLIEGICVVSLAMLVLRGGSDRLVYVVYLPALVGIVKHAVILLGLYRKTFVLSGILSYLRKAAVLGILLGISAGARMLINQWFGGPSLWEIGLRILVMFSPLGVYVAARVLPGR